MLLCVCNLGECDNAFKIQPCIDPKVKTWIHQDYWINGQPCPFATIRAMFFRRVTQIHPRAIPNAAMPPQSNHTSIPSKKKSMHPKYRRKGNASNFISLRQSEPQVFSNVAEIDPIGQPKCGNASSIQSCIYPTMRHRSTNNIEDMKRWQL